MNFDAGCHAAEKCISCERGSRKERTLVNWCCVLLKRLAMQLTPARSGRQPEGCAHQLVRGEFCAPSQSNRRRSTKSYLLFNTMYQIMMCFRRDIAAVCLMRCWAREDFLMWWCALATLFISHQPPNRAWNAMGGETALAYRVKDERRKGCRKLHLNWCSTTDYVSTNFQGNVILWVFYKV